MDQVLFEAWRSRNVLYMKVIDTQMRLCDDKYTTTFSLLVTEIAKLDR